jgi:hypothetical protein
MGKRADRQNHTCIGGHKDRSTDRLIGIQLDRISKPRGRKTNRQTDRRTYRQTDRQIRLAYVF